MAEFIYNNAKNMSIGHILLDFNYDYYFRVFFKNNINPLNVLLSKQIG